jgi:hypothetical protein
MYQLAMDDNGSLWIAVCERRAPRGIAWERLPLVGTAALSRTPANPDDVIEPVWAVDFYRADAATLNPIPMAA